jgi:hypothetical protein
LLSDISVPAFYPSAYTLLTDILDTFGNLVFDRIKKKGMTDATGNAVSLPGACERRGGLCSALPTICVFLYLCFIYSICTYLSNLAFSLSISLSFLSAFVFPRDSACLIFHFIFSNNVRRQIHSARRESRRQGNVSQLVLQDCVHSRAAAAPVCLHLTLALFARLIFRLCILSLSVSLFVSLSFSLFLILSLSLSTKHKHCTHVSLFLCPLARTAQLH